MTWLDDQGINVVGARRRVTTPGLQAPAATVPLSELAVSVPTDFTSPVLPNGQPNPNYRGNTGVAGDQSQTTVTPPAAATRLMEGDAAKLADPNHALKSPKYSFLQLVNSGKYGYNQMPEILAELQRTHPEFWKGWTAKNDVFQYTGDPSQLHAAWNGATEVDAIGNFTSTDGSAPTGWRWGHNAPNPAGALQAGTVPLAAVTQPAPTWPGNASRRPGTDGLMAGAGEINYAGGSNDFDERTGLYRSTGTSTPPARNGGGQTWMAQPGPLDGGATGAGAGGGAFGSLLDPWAWQFMYPELAEAKPFEAPTLEQVSKSPVFQFRLQEAQKVLERSKAAKGNLRTGGTLQELTKLAGDYASLEYDNEFSRGLTQHQLNRGQQVDDWARGYNKNLGEYRQTYDLFTANQDRPFNKLAAVAGTGQTSAQSLASLGQGYAGMYGNTTMGNALTQGGYLTDAAAANAAGRVGSANAWNSALGSVSNNANNAVMASLLFGGKK